jgi:hypothetical protein
MRGTRSSFRVYGILLIIALFGFGAWFVTYTITNQALDAEQSQASATPTPVPTPHPKSPLGYGDGANCTFVQGWACDPDDFTKDVEIHIYRGNTDPKGSFVGSITANQSGEEAMGEHCGGETDKRFKFRIPSDLIDGTTRHFWAWAINSGEGETRLLNATPMVLDTSKCEVPCKSLEECTENCSLADIQCDGFINIADFSSFVKILRESREDDFSIINPEQIMSDMNEDGRIDIKDFIIFKDEYIKAEVGCPGFKNITLSKTTVTPKETLTVNCAYERSNGCTHAPSIPSGFSDHKWIKTEDGVHTFEFKAPEKPGTYTAYCGLFSKPECTAEGLTVCDNRNKGIKYTVK